MTTLIANLGVAAVTLIVAFLSYRQATSANRQAAVLQTRKVDAEAFMSAQAIYKDAIATLEAQLTSARGRITELERRLGGLEQSQ